MVDFMKKCSTCKIEKDFSEFYKDTRGKDGLYAHCKECHIILTIKYAKINSKIIKQYQKQYAKANPEKEKAKRIRFTKVHPERIKASAAKWAKENPEKINIINQRRIALKLNAEGSYTKEQWIEVCEMQGYKCNWCYKWFEKLTMDHIVPFSKGGSNYIENIQGLCGFCNSSKKDRMIF